MTDELVKEQTDEPTRRLVQNARAIVAANPDAALVDPMEAQALTIGRESMHEFFDKINLLPKGMLKCTTLVALAVTTSHSVALP